MFVFLFYAIRINLAITLILSVLNACFSPFLFLISDPQCKVDPQLYRTADSFTKQNLEEMAMNFLNDDDPVAVKWR